MPIQSKWVADLPLTTWTFIAKYVNIEYNAIGFRQTAIQACIAPTGYIMASLQLALEEPFALFH